MMNQFADDLTPTGTQFPEVGSGLSEAYKEQTDGEIIGLPEQSEPEKEQARPTPEQRRQMRVERQIKLVTTDPRAIVVAPRTPEGHVLCRMARALDRFVNRLRIGAGIRVEIETVQQLLGRVRDFLASFEQGVTARTDPYIYDDDFERKRILAQSRTAYVSVPRTPEGRQMLILVRAIDPVLVSAKMTDDYEKVQGLVSFIVDSVIRLNGILSDLADTLNEDYTPPRGYAAIDRKADSIVE